MKYVSLEKQFYINQNHAENIYRKRFDAESSHIIDVKINDFQCFYMINEEILRIIDRIYSIDHWLEKILHSRELPELSVQWLIISSLVEEINTSNGIEGIYSTRKEISRLVEKDSHKKYKRFLGMVNKYKKLIHEDYFIIESCHEIRNLYNEILLQDILREDKNDSPDGLIFRKNPTHISNGMKVIHEGIYGEEKIIEVMDKSLKFLNDDNVNILIRVSLFHYLFEYIHPFYNGNGRMGRFIASGYLNNRLHILCALQLSIACRHHIQQYYQLFKHTNDIRNKADLTIFIIGFLEIYVAGLEELQEKVTHIFQQYIRLKTMIGRYLNGKYYDLVDILLQVTLFSYDGMTFHEMSDILKLSRPTLKHMINELNKEHEIIFINCHHKPYRYSINLDIFDYEH